MVQIAISDVTDLYAYHLDIDYDPTVLAAQSVTEDAFLAQGGTTIFFPGSIDNAGGSVANNAVSLEGFISGVTGSGVLLDFDFLAVGLGPSSLDLANVELLDSNFNDIPFTPESGSVDVTVDATAPEPADAWLAIAAAVAFFLYRHLSGEAAFPRGCLRA